MALKLPERKENLPIRRRVSVTGVVQGVGFRPYIYREAKKRSLSGWVLNNREGVVMEIEGPAAAVDEFLSEVQNCPLRLARIDAILCTEVEAEGSAVFMIRESADSGSGLAQIPADVALCPACENDVFAFDSRRFHYPFTNCTDCGPRFTIIRGVPYDRELTTMAGFTMCAECASEYHNPGDRRFHAEPNACPQCGPQVSLLDGKGDIVPGEWRENALSFLRDGHILAVKGLGGFHLVCNAANPQAVDLLRRRKGRPARPFAVMCRDLSVVRRHCFLDEAEAALLRSPAAPIVILRRRPECTLPEGLSPGTRTLGVMVPYTPLHLLLFAAQMETLVMTSGNESGLPLAKDNEEAYCRLQHTADYFLTHNRPVHRRCDDSLIQVTAGEPCMLRRSRGYVPVPCPVPVPQHTPQVFAAGGDLKNTFCYLLDGHAYLGPHIGDLAFTETRQAYLEAAAEFAALLDAGPTVTACDCHPGYHASRLARQRSEGDCELVWHHHAHLASCMAENMLTGQVIGVICDGTGYGPDGTIWGGEVLSGDYRDFQRQYHLEAVPLPGGEGAVRYPWRMAVSYLRHCLGAKGAALARTHFPQRLQEIDLLLAMLQSGFNSPPASSCGRLYDAVSALLGICSENTYDGQAPVELSAVARDRHRDTSPYPFTVNGRTLTCSGLFQGMIRDLACGRDPGDIAASFEHTVVAMFADAVERVRAASGLNRVVLSGGSFQNPYLLTEMKTRLQSAGFLVYTHRYVPANDGGLALGQALVAAWRRGSD
ncbi:MAG: carbamoyltransferase HypF [Bacillota bacterium]|nr:carbamoyltransferase HypF [Bacillota bacterium]MDW7684925.1 carbamoyltransferase HypF [Bacillota bacterium]